LLAHVRRKFDEALEGKQQLLYRIESRLREQRLAQRHASRSVPAGERSAIIYTVIETCRRRRIDLTDTCGFAALCLLTFCS